MSITVTVPFGDEYIKAELPDDTFMIPYGGGKKPEAIDDLDQAVDDALANPLGMPPIAELVKPGSKVCVAFDDPTVPAFGPIRRVALLAVIRELKNAGVADDAIVFICANSLHRKFPKDELAMLLGDDLVEQLGDRLFCHDAEDAENLVYLGKTEKGADVEISRYAAEADLTIYINAASYRGFAGGWKSVCVGLSTWRSIRHHHNPDGMSMSVEGNRMHEMLDEMGALTEKSIAGKIFKIDTVEANPFQSAAVFAGDVWETRKAALDILKQLYPARRSLSDERFDVIMYGLPNWSPYAVYAKMNPILTMISSGLGYLGGTIQALGKEDCTVIMATPCPLQWDDVHHVSYRDVWENVLSKTQDPYQIEKEYTEHYATHPAYIQKYRNEFSFHPIHGILATHPLRRLKHCGRVIIAGAEDPEVARHLGFLPANNIEDALNQARAVHGENMTVAYALHPAAPTKVNM
jgi:hypothetical protein